jgi:hypothetical protein
MPENESLTVLLLDPYTNKISQIMTKISEYMTKIDPKNRTVRQFSLTLHDVKYEFTCQVICIFLFHGNQRKVSLGLQ